MRTDRQDMPAWAPPVLFVVFLLIQIPALVWVGSVLRPGADLAAERADLIVPGLWVTWGIAFLVTVGVLQSSRWGEPWSPAALLVAFFGSLLPLSYILIGAVGGITRLPGLDQFWGLVGDNLFAIILWGVCLALYVVNVWMIWRSRWLVEWAPEGLLLLFAVSLVPAVYFLGGKVVELTGQFFGESFLLGSQLKSAPWAATAWFVNVMALAAVATLLFTRWQNLWAVGRKMIMEALNRKVVLVLLVFFVIFMPSLVFILKTEGNPKSQVQIVLKYSMALAELLLSVLAVLICTASICSEIEKKRVHITDTKPLLRWEFLLGKLLGVIVLCGALLFVMSGMVYGLTAWMVRSRDFSHLPPHEAQQQRTALARVRREVLVARRAAKPKKPNVESFLEKEIERRSKEGEFENPQKKQATRRKLKSQLEKRITTAPPMGHLPFQLSGFARSKDNSIYVRFEPHRTNKEADGTLRGAWEFFLPVKGKDGKGRLALAHVKQGKWVADAFQEIEVSGQLVNPDGVVRMAYRNLEGNTGVQFDPDEGIEVLQRVGSFMPNFYRSLLIVLCHILLLSAFALMLGAALSFPVASFAVAALLLVGLLGPWVAESALGGYTPRPDHNTMQMVFGYAKEGVQAVLKAIFAIAPQFGRFNATGDLVNGRIIKWGSVGKAAAIMVFIKGGIVMLLGIYIYWKRELAKVIA